MQRDIKKAFRDSRSLDTHQMNAGHEARFLLKLENELPKQKKYFPFWNIAVALVLFLGLSFAMVFNFNTVSSQEDAPTVVANSKTIKTKSLGDISPDLKKVEDYYLAQINLELSNVALTEENKSLFDAYVSQLDDLNTAYESLSEELTTNGPTEALVDALINNLKLRLNLLYRFKSQLSDLNSDKNLSELI